MSIVDLPCLNAISTCLPLHQDLNCILHPSIPLSFVLQRVFEFVLNPPHLRRPILTLKRMRRTTETSVETIHFKLNSIKGFLFASLKRHASNDPTFGDMRLMSNFLRRINGVPNGAAEYAMIIFILHRQQLILGIT